MSSAIHISREGQTLGQFEPEQIVESYSLGVLKGDDLAWLEGTSEWLPLETFIQQNYQETVSVSEVIEENSTEPQAREETAELPSEETATQTQEEPSVTPDAGAEAPVWGKATQLLPQMPRTDKNAFAEEKKTILWIAVIIVVMLSIVGAVYFIFS